MASLLAVLPESLVRNLLSSWFDVKCMSRLDVACCSKVDRPMFLAALSHSEISHDDSWFKEPHYCSKMLWMNARDVQTAIINLYLRVLLRPDSVPVMATFVRQRAIRLKVVEICLRHTNAETALRMLVAHKCSLTSLYVKILDDEKNASTWDDQLCAALTQSAASLAQFHIECSTQWGRHLAPDTCLLALRKLTAWIHSDEQLISICRAAPNLQSIDFTILICTGKGLEAIGQYCPQLESLSLCCLSSKVVIPTISEGLAVVAEKCTGLRHLTLHYLPDLTTAGLSSIFTHCTQLQECTLRGYAALTDASLTVLAQAAGPTMRSLVLNSCTGVRGPGILQIAISCPHLHLLELSSSPLVSCQTLELAVPHLHNLRHLTLNGMYTVTDTLLALIVTHMRELKVLRIQPQVVRAFSPAGGEQVAPKCEKLSSFHLPLLPEKPSGSTQTSLQNHSVTEVS